MDVVEYTPTREQYAYTFGGAAPAMRVKPGTALRLWSDDAFGGVLRSVDDLSSEKVDLRFVNPQTGPFYVEGAEPGDTLVAPPRRPGAGARLGRLGGDPVLRRHDEHRPRRHPAGRRCPTPPGSTSSTGTRHRRLRRAAQRPPDRAAGRADARHRRRGARRRRGALLAGAGPVRRQHGHPADAGRRDGLPRRQRRGRDVLDRRRPLPPGRGRGVRHRGRGRDDHDPDRRAHQGRRARLAADRGRHPLDDGRVEPAARGRVADRQRRARALGRRALRAAHDGRLPAAAPRSREVPIANVVDANYSVVVKAAKALLPAARRLRRHPRRPRALGRALSELPDPASYRRTRTHRKGSHGSSAHRQASPGDRRDPRHRPRHRRGASSPKGAVVGFCARDAERGGGDRGGAAQARATCTGRVVDVGDGDALAAWVEQVGRRPSAASTSSWPTSARSRSRTPRRTGRLSLNVDVMHTVRLVRAAMPHLERSDAASIIAISSVSGRESDFASGPYGTAKTAIVGYIHGLALQLADKGIRANTVSPGNTYFEGGVWAEHRAGRPGALRDGRGPQPHRPHGHARRRSPHRWSSSPARWPAGSAAPTSSSTAR